MIFPFGGNIKFDVNSASISKETLDGPYFKHGSEDKPSLIDRIKEKFKKYRGLHFTLCIHSASTFPSWIEVPPTKEQIFGWKQKCDVYPWCCNTPGVTEPCGWEDLLAGRTKAIQTEVTEALNADTDLKAIIPPDHWHVAAPSKDLMHFGSTQEEPSGLLLMIAEDRLHHTADDAESDIENCKIPDKTFDDMRIDESNNEFVKKLGDRAYNTLPVSFDFNPTYEDRGGRASARDLEEYIKQKKDKRHEEELRAMLAGTNTAQQLDCLQVNTKIREAINAAQDLLGKPGSANQDSPVVQAGPVQSVLARQTIPDKCWTKWSQDYRDCTKQEPDCCFDDCGAKGWW